MQNFGTPQGMRDILSEESSRRAALQQKLLRYMQCCGFNRVETPLYEYYELFSEDICPIDDESIIKTIDRDGRVVVLRPDMTIPVARLAATKLRDRVKPMKLFYMGNVYRTDGKLRGGARELYQIGGEIYGCTGKWPDTELISMVRGCFGEAGVSGYTVDIGHAGIVNGILKELPLTEQKKEYIRTLVSRKNLVELENEVSRMEIDSRYREAVLRLPCLFGRPEEVFEKLDDIMLNDTVRESAGYLFEVYERLKCMGLGDSLIIDAGMTGNVRYYTGIIFKAYAQGTSSVVISGGRYDDLMEKLGSKTPAAGFAVYIDGMVEALEAQGVSPQKSRKLLAVFNENRFAEASERAASLRSSGVTVNLLNYDDCTDLGQYAAEHGYDEILRFD